MPAVHTSNGVLFYAEGPDTWTNYSDGSYAPSFNAYSKEAYYYITTGSESDDAPYGDTEASTSPSSTFSTYDSRYVHALRTTNLDSSGRDWVGESYSSVSTATVSLDLPTIEGETVYVRGRMASSVSAKSTMTVDICGSTAATYTLTPLSGSVYTENLITFSGSATATSSSVDYATLNFAFNSSTEKVWLTFLAVASTAPLSLDDDQLTFRNHNQESVSGSVQYNISSASANTVVWDVTDPTDIFRLQTSLSGTTLSFYASGDELHEYVAFNTDGSFPSPTIEGSVDNHNVHADASVNFLVLTTPTFASYAERLCNLHAQQQGLSTRITYVDDIYDEFSAGRAEAPALRNYIKMLYDRGLGTADELQNVLLLGDGSYNNYDRTSANNVIPTYESETPFGLVASYVTDDFYCWLESGEGSSDTRATVDIGLGRIPVISTSEAEIAVSKIEAYMSSPVQGAWRSKGLFIGASGDENEHVGYAEKQASAFEEENPDMTTIRVFSEAYQRTSTATGYSYSQANSEAYTNILNGVSFFHYTGHGGSASLGDGYLTGPQLAALKNGEKLPVLVAATCTLSPFDQTHGNFCNSGLFSDIGGFIASFAASREVYGNGNYYITRPFVKYLYGMTNGLRNTFGYAMKMAKRNGPKTINSLKYNLIGDPAVTISTPYEFYAQIDSVNGVALDEETSPLKALAQSSLSGSIYYQDGTAATDFNGTALLTLYDKRVDKATSGVASGTPFEYSEWGSKLYSGTVEVSNGLFSAIFVLSKEFDLSEGYGRVTIYAMADSGDDAMGSCEQIIVGGYEEGAMTDTIGPSIEAWVDYPRYDDGTASSSTPVLYVILEDEQGINSTGQGVGHDISLVIDADRENPYVLNDYFTYETGSSQRGLVTYSLSDINEGKYAFTIKAWDNLNNSNTETFDIDLRASTSSLAFNVESLSVNGNFSVHFSSDAIGENISLRSRIYTLYGVNVLDTSVSQTLRNEDNSLSLNLKTSNLPSGIYIIRIDATTNAGRHGSLSKKIFVDAQ